MRHCNGCGHKTDSRRCPKCGRVTSLFRRLLPRMPVPKPTQVIPDKRALPPKHKKVDEEL